jgi:hypothetical protein
MVVRPDAGPVVTCSDAGGFFRRETFRKLLLEISLNDSGARKATVGS